MKKTKSNYASQWLKAFVDRHFAANALDDGPSRKILFLRLVKGFKSRESREIVIAMPILGVLVALSFLVIGENSGPLVAGLSWLFKNTTELEPNFHFLAIGLMTLLVATHRPLKKQGALRRCLFLPLFRIAGDTVAAAFPSFLVVALWCAAKGPIVLGQGTEAVYITWKTAAGSAAFYGFAYFIFTAARLLIDSPMTEKLTKPIMKKDPGLLRTLAMAGWGSFTLFGVACLALFGPRYL